MTGLQLLALADDLTGAMEVGAKFASRGICSAITAGPGLEPRGLPEAVRVLVIDTATRHLPAFEAGQKVHQLACVARESGIRFIFKKTDSTLRGNIGAELGAVMIAFADTPLIFAPAYPQMGRTVRGGILYVDDVPVSETPFGSDSLNPVRNSYIPVVLQREMRGFDVIVTSPGEVSTSTMAAVYVVDGGAEEDLHAAAKGFAGSAGLRLAAGPAGFAGHLADLLPLERSQSLPWPSIGTSLVVNGSRHDVSLRQVDHALSSGWTLGNPECAIEDLASSRWVVTRASDFSALAGEPLAEHVGRIVADLVAQAEPDALIVFGGDTAGGVLKALGSPMLRSLGEVLPGVPAAVVDAATSGSMVRRKTRDLILITKAGGFGPPDVLEQVRARMSRF